MPATHALIELLGEVALLLWGIRMVRTGVLRAFGADLRRLLGRALRHRLAAGLAGAGVTLALQSSTATALIAASFLTKGALGLAPALAVMLGANVGSALAAWALAFDATLLFPALLLAGLVTFRLGAGARPRNVGRAALGLGLVLLALHLLVETMAPEAATPAARALVAAATREPLPALALATLLTWAMHSSLAAVLVIASLAGAGLVTPVAGLALVLGANLGSALIPLLAATAASGQGQARGALRLALGNLATRLLGCALALPFLPEIADRLAQAAPDPACLAVDFHLAFNAALAALFLLPLPALAQLLARALPDRPRPDDPATPRYLDAASLGAPAVALANAAREALRMADVVEAMLQGSRALLRRDDPRLAAELRRQDDVLDRLHAALKDFLGALGRTDLSGRERERLARILSAALNLEHAGDIADKGLLALAAKRIRRRQRLPERELADADAMHAHLLAQLQRRPAPTAPAMPPLNPSATPGSWWARAEPGSSRIASRSPAIAASGSSAPSSPVIPLAASTASGSPSTAACPGAWSGSRASTSRSSRRASR